MVAARHAPLACAVAWPPAEPPACMRMQMEEEGVPSTTLREISLLKMLSESNHIVKCAAMRFMCLWVMMSMMRGGGGAQLCLHTPLRAHHACAAVAGCCASSTSRRTTSLACIWFLSI